ASQIRFMPRALWDMDRLGVSKPEARFAATPPLLPGAQPTVTLDAAASVASGSELTEFVWRFEDGPEAKGKQVTKALKPGATHRVTLQVRDKRGQSDTRTSHVTMPPAWLLALDPKTTVVAEAESFAAEGVGKVQIFDRVGNSGKMISYWHEAVGHWLEWKVNVPKSGRYKVVLKYATDSADTQRDFQVDGQHPGVAFKKFHLSSTGGFCTVTDNWAYHTVGGEKSPAPINLAAGPHTLRMTNLGDGCALDFILLVPVDG
ncbi:MAG: carbohydrate-binding protein, partial [Planctomycetes bacterium]|nr:carbohydrate-binding protein [Planctomycetota bacterium]